MEHRGPPVCTIVYLSKVRSSHLIRFRYSPHKLSLRLGTSHRGFRKLINDTLQYPAFHSTAFASTWGCRGQVCSGKVHIMMTHPCPPISILLKLAFQIIEGMINGGAWLSRLQGLDANWLRPRIVAAAARYCRCHHFYVEDD